MVLRQQLWVDDRLCIGKCGTEFVMVCDDHVDAAGIGVVDGFIGGNAGVAGEDEFGAAVDDRLEGIDVNSMTLLAADGNVVNDVRAQQLERLHQHGRGRLSVHVEVAPATAGLMFWTGVCRMESGWRNGRADSSVSMPRRI